MLRYAPMDEYYIEYLRESPYLVNRERKDVDIYKKKYYEIAYRNRGLVISLHGNSGKRTVVKTVHSGFPELFL